MTIRAITFDFWRTLFRDPLPKERFRYRAEIVAKATGVTQERAKEVFKEVSNRFLQNHIVKQETLSPTDAVAMVEQELAITLSPAEKTQLSENIAKAILELPLVPVDGAVDAVYAAAERFPVGIISDAGMSPSSYLRKLLVDHNLLEPFSVLTFSDEVGVAKPQPKMFERASEGLSVAPGELLHIGDLEPTDVAGAQAFGAKAALFTGDNDRFKDNTVAEYTFASWREFIDVLPSI